MAGNKGRVGVIGLGTMGGSVARNLTERGWTVLGYDVSPQRIGEAQAAGVRIASLTAFGAPEHSTT